ncbi:MAG: glycerol-3-phosphate 1-O-acyltransferase PlsY [Gammaproteobacteria bacterium]|nr:glycerol-3-phosphate 1-O-acyltransferase PlsY [Gammaproteobacteria bacterium]
MNIWLAAFAAYLLGSISFAVIVSKVFGLSDPRTYGSKNPGATNVLRSGNKWAAVLTLLGDGAKGWLAVWLALAYIEQHLLGQKMVALVAIAVFLGHLWPVFFKFVGGKGVATALGILLAVNWPMGLATFAVWLLVALIFRYSSLAALVAAIFAPCYYFFVIGIDMIGLASVIMSALLIFRHRTNMVNLLKGQEGRLGRKKVE